jgi:hypothetical protein
MRVASRLKALEGVWGSGPGIDRPNRLDGPLGAVWDGSARLRDFHLVMEPALPAVRAWVAGRSGRFRRDPLTGKQPWAWWPMDLAAAIASVPLDEEPDPELVERLLGHIRCWQRRGRLAKGDATLQKAASFCSAQWQMASAMIVALGAPDGRPLRTAIARGEFRATAGFPTPRMSPLDFGRMFGVIADDAGVTTAKGLPSPGIPRRQIPE